MLKLCANNAEISKLAQTKSYVLPSLHCRWTMINWDRRWQKQRREKKSWRVSWQKWGSQQGLLTNGAKSFLTTYAKTTSGSTAYRNITPASLGKLRPQRSVRRRSWASSGTSFDSTSRRRTPKRYAYLSVTYGQHDNYTDIYDGKMAYCCQKVWGNKHKNNNKTNKKWEEGGGGL